MYQIGDTVIYSQQGVCIIHDITEKTMHGMTKRYFIMHPIHDDNTTFYAPVDNDKIHMRPVMSREQAQEALALFDSFDTDWIEDKRERETMAKDVLKKDDPIALTKMVKILMERRVDTKEQKRAFSKADSDSLHLAQKLLFTEIACVLNTDFEQIEAQCMKTLQSANLV